MMMLPVSSEYLVQLTIITNNLKIMETQTYIECKKNSHGSVLYVYSQSPRSEEDPQLLEEIVLPESSEDVYKVVNNDKFICASFINHGANVVQGSGGVMVFRKRNDGKFHFIQTIQIDSNKVTITDGNQLNFGIDLELTDENLFITCTPTIENGDSHSYIGVYEFGEFFWELVQEFYGADADNASFKLDEFAYDQITGKSIYGGINSLAATTTDFVFCSNITESEDRPQNQKGLYSCIKLNGTWLLDIENPILHPQFNDTSVGGAVVANSTSIIGKPCMYDEWLAVSSYKCIKNSELQNKTPNEDENEISFIPCVLIYKKDEDGLFKFFQYLEYEEKCRLSTISDYENISVQMRGDHLVCYDENDLQTTLGEKIEAKYFYIDRTEKVRIGNFGKTYCWKYDSDFDFEGIKKPFILGGCPPCHPKETACGNVVLHLQSTDTEQVVSDVCHDIDITNVNHRPPMCDLYLNDIEAELGYVFKPLRKITEDVTIDYTQSYNQNSSNRWVTYGDYTNLPIELTPLHLSPDSKTRFVHMHNTSTWHIIDPYFHATAGMKGLEGTLRSSGMNQGALTYTFAKPTMVIAVTSLTSSWNHGGGIIGSWTQYTPRFEADRTCWTVYYKFFEAGDHVITNQGFFLYFRPLDLIPTPTPTPSPERTPTPTPERTPTPTPTYILHDMIMFAGSSNRDGLVLISWDGQDECLPFLASGRSRRFIVPDDVTQINVQCWGAGGGNGKHRYAGGAGGYAEGKIDVTPGELYIIGVGQTARGDRPRYSPGGSAGAGGTGMHRGAGAGGGMSGIFKESISSANALIIAGGGGGSSGSYQITNTGAGGGGGTNGRHGMRYSNDNSGGRGGSQTSGGRAGYCLAWSRSPQSGSRFRGGRGGTAGHSSGGGGGAGWFGGGGGGALMAADSAGGGGSGYIHESVIEGKMYQGDSGRARRRLARSHLPKPMPCEFVMPTPTPERTPTPTPDCPKIYWDIVDDDGNTISKESSTISLNTSKLNYGQQMYRNILTGMVGASNDPRVIRWGVKDYSSVSNIKLVLCDESEHDPLETEFITYSAGDDKTGLRMNLTFGVELTPTPIPQPSSGGDGDDGDGDGGGNGDDGTGDIGEPTQPIDRSEITASTCETQYLLLQPATDDTAILDKGSETFDITEKGQTKLNSDTKYFNLPTIKVGNEDESYGQNNALETNIGDMIIGTNDFTIETFIKFDDVKQDHRIIHHNETSRNRSSWILYHRGDRTEASSSFGDTSSRWFGWEVNNGHGSSSSSNRWVNHISFLSPISLENNTWYHIALVRKNVTNWAFYINGQKHEEINGGNMFLQSYSFGSYSGSIPSFSGPTYIGYNVSSNSGAFYMQSFRVANVAVYADEFNVPSSTLGAIDFKPMCENVAVDLQKSDSDDSIEDKSGSGISVTSDISVSEQTTFFRSNVGRVRVFNYENEKWELKFQEKGEVLDTGTALGYDMSASKDGNIFAFSTPYYNTDTKSNVGKVTIYESTGSSFTKRAEIIGDVENNSFGMYCELSANGDYLVLSKALETNINQVYVYKWNGSDYVLRDTINGAEAFDSFGGGSGNGNHNQFDISENGNILVVGAYSSDSTTAIRANAGVSFGGFPLPTTPTVTNFGRATVYKWSESSQEYVKHGNNIIGTSVGANAGWSIIVSRDGSTFMVGAPFTNTNGAATEGSIKIFNITDTGYEQIQEIKGDGSYHDINLGYTFDLSANGNILVIGKSYNQKVAVYEKNDASQFVERNVILGASLDSNVSGFNFGSKVSTNSDGSRIVISHSTSDVVAGSAGILYVMDYVNDDYVLLPNTIESLYGESLGGSPFQISDDGLKLIASSSGYDHRETKQTISFSESSSDIIVVGNNSDFNFLHNGTTDYTIECNFKVTKWHNSPVHVNWSPSRLFSNIIGSSAVGIDGVVMSDSFANDSSTTSATDGRLIFNIHRGELKTVYKAFKTPAGSIHLNTEYKLAIVFSGGEIKVFLNGVAQDNEGTSYTVKNSASKSNASTALIIGAANAVSHGLVGKFNGTISKFKIVRSALYNCNYNVDDVSGECYPPKIYSVNDPESNVRLLVRSDGTEGIKDFGCYEYNLTNTGSITQNESNLLFDEKSINFNGSSHITIPNSRENFSFLNDGRGTPYTVETWVRVTSTKQYQTAIATCSWTGETGFMILIHNLTPQIVIGKSVAGRWRLTCNSNKSLIINQWHHVAFSVDNFGKCKLFIDGKVVGEAKFNDTVNKLPTSNLVIGAEADGKNKLVGQLQDVRISNVAVYSGRFIVPNAFHSIDCSNVCVDPIVMGCTHDVALHIKSDTFNSSDAIVDSSVNNLTITKNGNVHHSNSKAPFGRSSLYFDGTNDYLQVEASADLQFGTNDFTIEFWVNFPTSSSHFSLQNNKELTTAEGKSRWVIEVKPTQISFITHSFGDTISNSGIVIPVNQWHHLAFVRKEGVMTLYYNGEEVKTGDLNEDYDQNGLNIGSYSRTDGVYTSSLAFIQDLRISKKAVYTSCFDVPKTFQADVVPIPANEPSCGEVALNIQSDVDRTQSVKLTYNVKIPNHSVTNLANGTYSETHNINITEDTTVTDFKFKYSNAQTLGVANGSTWQVFNQKITYPDGTSQTIELRDRKLTPHSNAGHHLCFTFDVPYTKVVDESITDISVNAHAITKHGDVKHSSAESIYGESSLYFDGNGDYLSVENSDDFNFGSSDYTVEFWINTPNTVSTNVSNATQIIGKHTTASSTNSAWVLLHLTNSKEIRWQAYSGETSSNVSVTIPDNTWVHIAIIQSDNTLKMYKDGVLESETTMHGSMNISTSRTLIGAVDHNGSLDTTNYAQMFSGYLQDLRISKKAVYTGCFALPASLHTNLVTTPNEPSCDEVALSVQSDISDIDEKVTLGFNIKIPGHPIAEYNNGTMYREQKFSIYGDETIVDNRFVHSIHYRIGNENVSTWTISNAKFTYEDGTQINAELRNRKNVRETVSHGANGMQDGHSVKYTFDIPNVKELPNITDTSQNAHTITKYGDTKHSSAKTILGDSSLYFDGNGDYLKINQTSTLNLTGNFTVEGWFYFVDTPADPNNNGDSYGVITCWPNNHTTDKHWQLIFTHDQRLIFGFNGHSTTHDGSSAIYENLPLNQWHHVAVVGNQDVVKMYVNGTPTEGGFTGHAKYSSWIEHPIYIGTRDMPHYDYGMDGKFYAQDIRISKKAVYTGCFVPPNTLLSKDCLPTPTPTPEQTPTPIPQQDTGNDGEADGGELASTVSTLEAAAGTKVIEIPDSDTSKFSANMEIVIAPDDDTKREENVIDSIGSLYLKNELQNTHPAGTRIVEKATSNNEDDEVEAPIECSDGQTAVWQYENGEPCDPNSATLKTFFGLSANLNNEWENVFNGLSIKFGQQETANGVDYLPIYAKVDNVNVALSSSTNISEWNKLYIFVGDNKNPNTTANGEGVEFDTIVSDEINTNDSDIKSISANLHFRFANINGIPTLQIKNILQPTNSVFSERNTKIEWSSVYVGDGYDLNDDVWPSASVDVNYEIGPITYSSLECIQVCVDEQTPTPTFASYYFADDETNCVLYKDQEDWFGTNHNICFDLNTNEVRFADLRINDSAIPDDFIGNQTDVNYAIVKKDALQNITDLIELEDMVYDSNATFAWNSDLSIRDSYDPNSDSPSLHSANSYLNANHNLQYTIYNFIDSDNPNYFSWKGDSEVVLIMFYGDYNGTTSGPGSRRILGYVEFAEV